MIVIELKEVMKQKGLMLKTLASQVGVTNANLSRFRKGRTKAIKYDLLNAICEQADCQPGDILKFVSVDSYDPKKHNSVFIPATEQKILQSRGYSDSD